MSRNRQEGDNIPGQEILPRRLVSGDLQPVSNPRFSDKIARSYWVWLNFPPQIADVDLQHMGFAFVSRPPDSAQQLIVGQHFPGVFDERPQ